MVVPPADDGSLADIDTTSTPSADGSRPSPALALLAVVFAVVLVACLTVLTVRYVKDTDGSSFAARSQQLFGVDDAPAADDTAGREAVMSQADQFMLRVNTYGPGDLDENDAMPTYAALVREVITPKFAVDFDKNVTLAEQSVAKAGYARSAKLLSTGVESIDADSATVLVAGIFSSSYPDSRRKTGRISYPDQPFRVAVSLVKIKGAWLVDDFTPVTDPTDPATGQSTAPAPGTPTAKPTSKPTAKPTRQSTNGAGGSKR